MQQIMQTLDGLNSNYIDMSVALYQEVANAAYSCINAINFGSDWVSLD